MPVRDLQRRHREIGRLRMGAKSDKGVPVKLKTWRLTSANLEALAAAAKLWGGEVNEWENGYELITETAELPVLVPPQDLEGSQWYTLYSGGGILRRCDGTTELETDGPCICLSEIEGTDNERQCAVTTHLLVVLPQLPDIGVWRLTTHGWNAASELANTIDVLERFVARGNMPEAVLAIEPRTSKQKGTTRNFIVPVLRIPRSLAELGEGLGQGPAALPGTPFDPETGEILEATPELSARAEQGETAGPGPAPDPAVASSGEATPTSPAPGPGTSSEGAVSPADPSATLGEVVADDAGPEEPSLQTETSSGSAPPDDDGTPATDQQWAMLDGHKINANKILTQARKLFPDAGIKTKAAITKHQFAKAFGALMDDRAGIRG